MDRARTESDPVRGSERAENVAAEDAEMEEGKNRPEGERERWKWLWRVVPCEDLFLEDVSIGCTLEWK